MVWNGENNFDADLCNLDPNTVRGVVSIQIENNCPCLGKSSGMETV